MGEASTIKTAMNQDANQGAPTMPDAGPASLTPAEMTALI